MKTRFFYLSFAAFISALLLPPFVQADLASAATPTAGEAPIAPAQSADRDTAGKEAANNGQVFTLSKCIEIALKQNPTVIASVNNVGIYRSRVGQQRSSYYPQLSVIASYERSKSTSGSSSIITSSSGSAWVNTASGTVSLSQNLLDFGKTSSLVDIAKYNLEGSQSDLLTTQDTIIQSVKQAYYGVLQAKRSRDVAADVITQFQLHLDQAKGFYEVGTKARIDVIKAEVDLSNAKLSLINAENSLKIAWVTLNIAMGTPDAPEYAIEDNLSFQKYPIALEEATAKALENRPDLKSTIAKRLAAEENVSYSRSAYYPVLSGGASYTKSQSAEADAWTATPTNNWGVGVTLTVPLFSGFLTQQQVAEAKSNLYVLRANEESTRQQLLLEVRQAYLNLQAAEAGISTTELTVKQAKENLDLANGRYAAGVGSPIEVSDAFATYVSAQANYTNSLYNYKIDQANIEKAMGVR